MIGRYRRTVEARRSWGLSYVPFDEDERENEDEDEWENERRYVWQFAEVVCEAG